MPDKGTMKRVEEDRRLGKAPSTQAGEFIREEMDHIREGKHGARSAKQAIAIGLSKARRAGIDLPPPKKGTTSERTRQNAERAYERGHDGTPASKRSAKRSRAISNLLKHEGHSAASHEALSKQAHRAARERTTAQRSASAKKAARTRMAERRNAGG
jgi:hypothetical protein